MLTIKHFRIRVTETGEWMLASSGVEDLTTAKRADGYIFEPDEREFWEDHEEFEIVELTESELMEHYAQTGLSLEPPKRYNVRESGAGGMWVVSEIDKTVYFSVRQSEARIFTKDEIEPWRNRYGFEIVEIPNPFGVKGKVEILKLPGF